MLPSVVNKCVSPSFPQNQVFLSGMSLGTQMSSLNITKPSAQNAAAAAWYTPGFVGDSALMAWLIERRSPISAV
jgi:poly(3-hydroxybutyrate) depolymerase